MIKTPVDLHGKTILVTGSPGFIDFEAHRELVGMQPGKVPVTYADSEALERDYGFTPKIPIRAGLRAFVEWYRSCYR